MLVMKDPTREDPSKKSSDYYDRDVGSEIQLAGQL
jgi:hypothetical protein